VGKAQLVSVDKESHINVLLSGVPLRSFDLARRFQHVRSN